jgi:hypothetical protein
VNRLVRISSVLIALSGLGTCAWSAPPRARGRLAPTADMHARRADHTSTLLPDGRVLIAGGMVENGVFLNSAEIYDPAKGTFTLTGSMTSHRVGHTATLLPDGHVLIAGGLAGRVFEGGPGVVASTEIYDPGQGRFTPGPPMHAKRSGQAAVLLKNGEVLIAGGEKADGRPLASAEIYDPSTNRFVPTGNMVAARMAPAAALLNDGRVLVCGGGDTERRVMASAEVYDPATGRWSAVGQMTAPRTKHAATTLADGRVLITGGAADWSWHPVPTAELFDPRTGRFTPLPAMGAARFKLPRATALLRNGDVLVAGGAREVEVFEAGAERFVPAGSLDKSHFFSAATRLADGRVLISGGYGTGDGRANGPVSSALAWIYEPAHQAATPPAHAQKQTVGVSSPSRPPGFAVSAS